MSNYYGSGSSERALKIYDHVQEFSDPENVDCLNLGPAKTVDYLGDPKRLGFMLARYKFVSKMLYGCQKVLEVGCQEGFGTVLVAKEIDQIIAVDFYKPHLEVCIKDISTKVDNIEFLGHDIIGAPVDGEFDAAFSLDVLEHIDPEQEDIFMKNICQSLSGHGVFVLGIPSLESQEYASKGSKAGHINCKSGEDLKSFCQRFFYNVFMFGMNDEVVHTGFMPMNHYLFALCVGPK